MKVPIWVLVVICAGCLCLGFLLGLAWAALLLGRAMQQGRHHQAQGPDVLHLFVGHPWVGNKYVQHIC